MCVKNNINVMTSFESIYVTLQAVSNEDRETQRYYESQIEAVDDDDYLQRHACPWSQYRGMYKQGGRAKGV